LIPPQSFSKFPLFNNQEIPVKFSNNFKTGYVSLIGQPNVGKSTLLNKLLDFRLSIVTRKPQTTRKKIIGILNGEDHQIIFIDTPGILEPKYGLQKMMMQYIKSAVEDADIIIYMVDISSNYTDLLKLEKFVPFSKPAILIINKIDLVKRDEVLLAIDFFQKIYKFSTIIPISALKSDGLDIMLDEIKKELPYSPPYFPSDYVTDLDERFFVAEIIREKIFLFFGEEIPYSTHVNIEVFKESDRKKIYIRAIIFVEKQSQKGILIGKNGKALKRIGEKARKDIEIFLDREIYLELFVKVLDNWRKLDKKLRNLGF
jgi:GTP-binding protein Era